MWLFTDTGFSATSGDDLPLRTSEVLTLLTPRSVTLLTTSATLASANDDFASVVLPPFRSLDFDDVAEFDRDPFEFSNISEFDEKPEDDRLSGRVDDIKVEVAGVLPFFSLSPTFPKFAGLGPIVVSMKFAVVNFPMTFLTPVEFELTGVTVEMFFCDGSNVGPSTADLVFARSLLFNGENRSQLLNN